MSGIVLMEQIKTSTKILADDSKSANKAGIDEHMMPLEAVCKRYNVNVSHEKPQSSAGLTDEQVKEKIQVHGPNIMTPPKQVPLVLQYLLSLSNLFNLLLIISGVLCFIVYGIDTANASANLYIGPILIGIAMINALIEFVQEQQSKAILKSFLDLVPRKCTAIRNNLLQSVDAANLVPGDVICIRMGDKIPADALMFHCLELKVDNSSLTGESDPQERKPNNQKENPLEAANLVFNGTLAVNGEGYGIVIRTGDHTVLGQIANMASSEVKRDSPMSQEIKHFVHIIATVAATVAIIFFLIAMLSPSISGSLATKINFTIGVFVSFVPEGLPATVTMLLTVAAKRMAKRNVLVKDLRGVETLGAITCLATDKTGTLTRNQMTVTNIWTGQILYDALSIEKKKEEPSTNVSDQKEMKLNTLPKQALNEELPLFQYNVPELAEMANISCLCSKAKFDRMDVPLKQRNIIADATETGLFKFSAEKIPESDTFRDRHPKVFEIPFNSSNKWALTIHQKPHSDGVHTLYIKGAPERVFKLCKSIVVEGNQIQELTEAHKAQFQKYYEIMASKGHRVIGCAKLLLSDKQYPEGFAFRKDEESLASEPAPKGVASGIYPQEGYTFMGLISLEDPPKHGVREAIGKCRQAGIKVMMVTGDHPLTAEAIARKINLMLQETKEMVAKRTNRNVESIQEHEYHAIVIHGEKIDALTEQDWENILDKEEVIFARTSPKHKLQIVKRCQERGHIVGVTGDGVNDSPALKKADLGIAMNISGSDVSKEAAAMILLDDNFASTVSGIAEGRLIFQNLKKSIRYTLTHIMPEVLANLLFLVVPIPTPLDPLQIILIDVGFELLISLAYAWEPPENGLESLLSTTPRKPVTARSMDLLRRTKRYQASKEEEINKYMNRSQVSPDPEQPQPTNGEVKSWKMKTKYRLAQIRYFFAHLFDRKAWNLYFEATDDEVLVDKDLLSYSYLEMGILETIGCLLAYFLVWWFQFNANPAAVRGFQVDETTRAPDFLTFQVPYTQTVYYFSIFFLQSYNHFICKCTVRYPFGLSMFKNMYTWCGLLGGTVMAMIVAYAPGQPVPFSTVPINPVYWLPPLGFGLIMLAYGTLRLFFKNLRRPANLNLNLPLDLHPTRWSTKSAKD